MTLPNFFVLGAAKSGTTALYHYLKQHPAIYMSPLKETGFFDAEGEALDFRGPGDMDRPLPINNLDDYQEQFKGVSGEVAIGEACTDYLYSPKAPERIYHYIPDAKLIAILRDPAERAFSQFLGNSRDGYEPLEDFDLAIQEEDNRIANRWHLRWHYKQRGFYCQQLLRYHRLFDKNQIKIYLYEDYLSNPTCFLRDIFTFLGVDSDFVPNMSHRYNAAPMFPKNKLLHALLLDFRNRLPKGKRFLNPLINRNLSYYQMNLRVRKKLIHDYQEDVLKLQDLIDRDLSMWLKV